MVAPAPEAGYHFLSLSAEDANATPTVRNATSGAAIVRSTVRSDANGTLYRVGPCTSGALEVVTPVSYGVYSCASAVSSAAIQSLATRISVLETRMMDLNRTLARLNLSTVAVRGDVAEVAGDQKQLEIEVSNVTAAVASLKRDVKSIVVPSDLALGSDLDDTEATLSEKLDEIDHNVPLYVYALAGLNLVALGLAGFVMVSNRWTGGKPSPDVGPAAVAVRDPAARMIREALLGPKEPETQSAKIEEPAAIPPPVLPAETMSEPEPQAEPAPQPEPAAPVVVEVPPPIVAPVPTNPIVSTA